MCHSTQEEAQSPAPTLPSILIEPGPLCSPVVGYAGYLAHKLLDALLLCFACFVYLFVLDLFILSYVCECFTHMYVCAQYAGLSLRRSEEVVGFPQTRVKDDCDPPPHHVFFFLYMLGFGFY